MVHIKTTIILSQESIVGSHSFQTLSQQGLVRMCAFATGSLGWSNKARMRNIPSFSARILKRRVVARAAELPKLNA